MSVLIVTGGNNGIGFYKVKQWLENGKDAAVLTILMHSKRITAMQMCTVRRDRCDGGVTGFVYISSYASSKGQILLRDNRFSIAFYRTINEKYKTF